MGASKSVRTKGRFVTSFKPYHAKVRMADPETTRIALVLVLLLCGGAGFNFFVSEAQRRDYADYSWAFVVVGVGVTLTLGSLIVGATAALWLLACFTASGTPMVLGSLWRREQRLRAEKAKIERERRELDERLLELHGHKAATARE